MIRRSATRTALYAGLMTGLSAGAPALAGGFALDQQSAEGQGLDFAGVAAGAAGLGSMYWNPATMTGTKGFETQLNASGLFPYASIKPTAGTSPILTTLGGMGATGDIAQDALLPSGYVSYQVDERWWLGVAANSPFGLTTKDPTNYAGQIYARTSSVRSYDVNPTMAYKASDWLSIGAGIQLLSFKSKLSQATSPLAGMPSATLDGKGWGWGLTAGATLTPRAGTELGVGYRSSVDIEEHGKLALGAFGVVPAKALMELPDQVTVGLRQAVTPDLTLNATYEWTRWSALGTVTVVNPATAVALPFHYADASFVSLGADYAYNERLTLRAGLGYEWAPISTAIRDLRLPSGDMLSLSAGAGYRFSDHLSADLAYTHYFSVGGSDVDIVPGNPHYLTGLPFTGKATVEADIASAGITYRW